MDSVFARSDWLFNLRISGANHYFTPSSSEWATPNSRKLRAKWLPSVCCVNKPKKLHTKIKQAVPEIHQEGDEIWFVFLTGKALSVSLEFIDETGEKVFFFFVQIKSCVTLFSWQCSKRSLKLGLKNSQLFLEEIYPQELNKFLQKFYFW